MPFLEINACIDCPHHGIDNRGLEYVEDMFGIRCEHPEQEHVETFQAKIKHKENHIYFNCPLNTKDHEESY